MYTLRTAYMCVFITVYNGVQNRPTALNSSSIFTPDNHHSTDYVYWRGGPPRGSWWTENWGVR